jgi:hypothetical protein
MKRSRSTKTTRKRAAKRDLFAELSEGMAALADARQAKSREESHSPEAKDTLRALRRAARGALELGLQTGTPVYVWKNNQIVDLTKEQRPSKRTKSKCSPRS